MNISNLPESAVKNLPDWVRYIAQDEDGQWWGYEAEPNRSHIGWYENEVGRIYKMAKLPANPGWISTLIRVN